MSNNERNLDMKELQKGIQMVLAAFNEQKEQYIKIINSLKERIMSLEEEMMKLKEENSLYQNKLYTLQKNIKNISKTICQIKDDEESIDERNNSYLDKSDKSNSNEDDESLKITLIKKRNKEYFKKYNLNKLEMKKPIKINHKNPEINNYFKEDNNSYSRDDDIQIKKKDNNDINYMKNIYNTLNNKKIKNKKDSKSKFSNIKTEDNDNFKNIETKKDNEVDEISLDNNINENQNK